jgi:hypothetical protein
MFYLDQRYPVRGGGEPFTARTVQVLQWWKELLQIWIFGYEKLGAYFPDMKLQDLSVDERSGRLMQYDNTTSPVDDSLPSVNIGTPGYAAPPAVFNLCCSILWDGLDVGSEEEALAAAEGLLKDLKISTADKTALMAFSDPDCQPHSFQSGSYISSRIIYELLLPAEFATWVDAAELLLQQHPLLVKLAAVKPAEKKQDFDPSHLFRNLGRLLHKKSGSKVGSQDMCPSMQAAVTIAFLLAPLELQPALDDMSLPDHLKQLLRQCMQLQPDMVPQPHEVIRQIDSIILNMQQQQQQEGELPPQQQQQHQEEDLPQQQEQQGDFSQQQQQPEVLRTTIDSTECSQAQAQKAQVPAPLPGFVCQNLSAASDSCQEQEVDGGSSCGSADDTHCVICVTSGSLSKEDQTAPAAAAGGKALTAASAATGRHPRRPFKMKLARLAAAVAQPFRTTSARTSPAGRAAPCLDLAADNIITCKVAPPASSATGPACGWFRCCFGGTGVRGEEEGARWEEMRGRMGGGRREAVWGD